MFTRILGEDEPPNLTKVSRPKLVTLVDAVAERGEARQPYGGKIGRLIRTGGFYILELVTVIHM